ncbi:hypothetical protein HanRHA438_Chr06g0281161 [Helianthus annuus]|uniref:Uncharacterized protein n=1 Tax=Helianthus annuus TaxID=4232 RepID=A0A251TUZ9_HELAN|nr:hypothetical protein HanXRQr2_Chr06g0272101 [Helianthus annuus]KAJ0913052.1 hypothetical protein HanRHA438_Chr06g0281161 [Helianthus annuus]KAJ0916525.1 hypothetical protein HanPSC8_Chr06g0262661 [Helianthus annuus]
MYRTENGESDDDISGAKRDAMLCFQTIHAPLRRRCNHGDAGGSTYSSTMNVAYARVVT